MTRTAFIVSRQHPELYVYLRERFTGEENIEVILDRRWGERRRLVRSVRRERRRGPPLAAGRR
jgi:hypothetical protein